MNSWNRRELIQSGVSIAALAAVSNAFAAASATSTDTPDLRSASQPHFRERGYYITFMRAPLFTFETWKGILNAVKQDGGNLVILWMGGAFPSRKFPITWKYNSVHENNKHNFAGKLIDYGHTLGLKVLLCLTPYGYDGVNQYAIEHPELKAINREGNFTAAFGLDAWGFNLNPYRPEARRFMLEYTHEMLEFYPNADGLLLESSDYAISYCKDCPETYYQKEFEFVRQISDDLWAAKPDATIAVYPHYFSGSDVPGLNAKGAKEQFDPRWTLFFTPHSTQLEPELIRQAKSTLYWDPSPTFGRPKLIQAAAQRAMRAGFTGFVPSFEPWNFTFSGPDMGDPFLIGQRSSPFGFGWLKPGETPVNELLMRMDRLAYREFSRTPDLPFAQFRLTLSREVFQGKATEVLLDDLLLLDESFFLDRTWDSTSAIASPAYLKSRIELGHLGPERLAEYRDRLRQIAGIAQHYAGGGDPATEEMARVAQWITKQWAESPDNEILERHLR
jgi:hypothetical protein